MRSLRGALLLLAAAFPFNAAVAAQQGPYALAFTPARSAILPFEPVGVLATVQNVSETDQTLLDMGRPPILGVVIEKKERDRQKWAPIVKDYVGIGGSPGVPSAPLTLKPRESVKEVLDLQLQMVPDTDGRGGGEPSPLLTPVFPEPGTYELRASIYSRHMQSEPQTMTVREPRAVDKEAYVFLKKNPLFRWFSKDQVRLDYHWAARTGRTESARFVVENRQAMDQFALKFPKSRYADWTRLAQLYLKEAPLEVQRLTDPTPETISQLDTLRGELERLAKIVGPEVAGIAWYEAGYCALLAENSLAAKEAFSHAVAGKDPSIPARIELTYLRFDNASRPPLPRPEPRVSLDETVRRLERDGFDVQGFAARFPADTSAYSLQRSRLTKDLAAGKIGEQAYHETLAKLLDAMIRKRGRAKPAH